MNRNFFLKICFVFSWVMVLCVFMAAIFQYENTPGPNSSSSDKWPSDSKIERAENYQLILFVHPHCPCTDATFEELKVILTKTQDLRAAVVFVYPADCGSEWFTTNNWKKAGMLPNTSIIADSGGFEAKCFGAKTSGQTLLYDSEGNLLFNGGITISRGHVGNNFGRNSILAYVVPDVYTREQSKLNSTPVFGCLLIE